MNARDKAALHETLCALLANASAALKDSPDAAVRLGTQARAVAVALRDRLNIAEADLLLARAMLLIGQPREAQQALTRAMPVFVTLDVRPQAIRCYRLFATLLFEQNQYSHGVAMAREALTLPGLPRADRARFHLAVAVGLGHLLNLPAARETMERFALPEVEDCGDPEAIVELNYMMAGLEAQFACIAGGITLDSTFGMERPPQMRTPEAYLRAATRYVRRGAPYRSQVNRDLQLWTLDVEAWVCGLRDGVGAARPLFESAIAACGKEFGRVACKLRVDLAVLYRIAGEHAAALEHLEIAGRMPEAQAGRPRRAYHFERSLLYDALGRKVEALEDMRRYAALNAAKTTDATAWHAMDTPPQQLRSGELIKLHRELSRHVDPAFLRNAIRFVEQNVNRHVSIAELARSAGVSSRTLQSAFRRFRGVTPAAFVRQVRMQTAHEMLKSTPMNIGEVALRIGYSTPANFSRDYRRHFGVPPSRA